MTAMLLTWEDLCAARDRMLWAARHERGTLTCVETPTEAETLLTDPIWRARQVLYRPSPRSAWRVIADAAGMEQLVEWRHVRAGDAVRVDGTWRTVRVEDIVRVTPGGERTHDERARVVAIRLLGGDVHGAGLHRQVLSRRRRSVPREIL